MNISFGQKIPIMQCTVQNIGTKKFVPATVYEYDCTSKNDAYDIDEIDGYWIFKPQIFHQAKDKCSQPIKYQHTKIYSLETNKGETLGMMVTDKDGDNTDVDVLETKYMSGHKYVGTALLSAAAQETLKRGDKKLTVKQPIPDVRNFYIIGCGFEETNGRTLEIENKQLINLIKKTEEKTQTQLIDLKG